MDLKLEFKIRILISIRSVPTGEVGLLSIIRETKRFTPLRSFRYRFYLLLYRSFLVFIRKFPRNSIRVTSTLNVRHRDRRPHRLREWQACWWERNDNKPRWKMCIRNGTLIALALFLILFCDSTSSECTQLGPCVCRLPDGYYYNLTSLADKELVVSLNI